MGNEASADAFGNLVNGVAKTLANGGDMGKDIWYQCPYCKKDCWAKEMFVGTPCWSCSTGNKEIANVLSETGDKAFEIDPKFYNRLNRYETTMENGYLEKPLTTMLHSNFKKVYDNYKNKIITNNDIINVLKSNNKYKLIIEKYNNLSEYEYNTIPKKCIYLWSLECDIYKDLCLMLEEDDYFKIKCFMPIIRSITKFIVNNPTNKKYITYRGSHMVDKQFNNLKNDQLFRVSKFLATSEDKNVAKQFIDKNATGVVITFNIPKGCYNAASISKYSFFKKDEAEILLPPYTIIKVININRKNKTVEVNVLDNSLYDLDTPQIYL